LLKLPSVWVNLKPRSLPPSTEQRSEKCVRSLIPCTNIVAFKKWKTNFHFDRF
jgi:hypothetical protein